MIVSIISDCFRCESAGSTGVQTFTFSNVSARISVSLAVKPEVATATVSHLTLLGVG